MLIFANNGFYFYLLGFGEKVVRSFCSVHQGLRSQAATPEGSPLHLADRDNPQPVTSSGTSTTTDKIPAPSGSGGGFMSWMPSIRSSSVRSNADATSTTVGPMKSDEDLVSGPLGLIRRKQLVLRPTSILMAFQPYQIDNLSQGLQIFFSLPRRPCHLRSNNEDLLSESKWTPTLFVSLGELVLF